MIQIVKNIFFGLVAFVAALIVLSFFLSDKYTVEQSIHIKAPVEIVFKQINNLKKWEKWSYFANLDPKWEVKFGNWSSGKDATMYWKSQTLGDGKLKIIQSFINERILVHFDYDNDKGKSGDANYLFRRENDGTRAIFRLEFPVPLSPIEKFQNVFFPKKNQSKEQFEYSLKRLKGVSEKEFREYLDNG